MKRGQSLTEFAILVGVLALVMTEMSLYLKRYFQAKYKEGIEYSFRLLNETARNQTVNLQIISQYEPYYKERIRIENKTGTEEEGFPNRSIDIMINQTEIEIVGVPTIRD
jgi:hypothetical protein